MPLSLDKQNAYRERYARMHPGWSPATVRFEALIRRRLTEGGRVLDLGCGRGGALEQLGDAVSKPVGIDPDVASLMEHRLLHLPRAAATAGALPLRDACVDIVLSSWVLEHLTDPLATFREVTRVLAPGGAFVFLTPSAYSLAAIANRTLRHFQSWLVPRVYGRDEADTFPIAYRANSRRRIEVLAQGSGLRVERLAHIEDPTYFAFHPLLFRINAALAPWLPREMAEHLLGVCVKA